MSDLHCTSIAVSDASSIAVAVSSVTIPMVPEKAATAEMREEAAGSLPACCCCCCEDEENADPAPLLLPLLLLLLLLLLSVDDEDMVEPRSCNIFCTHVRSDMDLSLSARNTSPTFTPEGRAIDVAREPPDRLDTSRAIASWRERASRSLWTSER